MVGTHPQTMGGISTVIRGYMAGGLFDRVDAVFVPTHRDGTVWRKAWVASTALSRIAYLLSTDRSLLVHVHMSQRASFWRKWLICSAARVLRRRYIVHVHGSEFMAFFDNECGRAAKRAVHNTLAGAALVLALSQQWQRDLLRICPTARVEVFSNAVEVPDPSAWRARDPAQQTILFLGRLGLRKGTFDLVRAFASVASQFPNATLVCAGDGAIAETQTLARELGVAARVQCVGWLGPDRILQQLARATIFALPSHAEGVPMALLEAMAWGLPVVTTAVGGIPEVVQDGHNGLLLEPGDSHKLAAALATLLTNGELRHRMAENARLTILERYSREAAIERLQAIYARFGVPAKSALVTPAP